MRGKVLAGAEATKAGLISGEDGQRYRFTLPDVHGAAPRPGQDCDFEARDGEARDIYLIPGSVPAQQRNWTNFYLSPRGRISRREYWVYGFLFLNLFNLLVVWIPIVGQIIGLVTTWASIAVAIKRCHDLDRTGWWVVAPALLFVAAGIFAAMASVRDVSESGAMAAAILCAVLGVGVSLWLLFAVFLQRGQDGANRYGPDPLVTAN